MAPRILFAFVLALTVIVGSVLPAFTQAKPPVVVALVAALSGGSALSGEAIKRGLTVAIDEINAKGGVLGGRKLELVLRDEEGNPSKGVTAARDVIEREKAVAVFGGLHSPVGLAMMPVFHELKVPYVGTWAAATNITRNGKTPNFMFRVSANDDIVDHFLAKHVIIGSRLVGVIASVHSDPQREFGEADLRKLAMFAPQAAIAIENARLFEAEKRRAVEQQALLDTMRDLSGELELSKLLHGVLERAVGLLRVDGGELATYDQTKDDLVIVASHNLETDTTGTRMAIGEGAMGRVAETHEPFIIPRYQEWEGRSRQYTQSTIQTGSPCRS